jgi:hypothetical protein
MRTVNRAAPRGPSVDGQANARGQRAGAGDASGRAERLEEPPGRTETPRGLVGLPADVGDLGQVEVRAGPTSPGAGIASKRSSAGLWFLQGDGRALQLDAGPSIWSSSTPLPYEKFPRFHEVMVENSGQSVLSSLESHVLPLAPGLTERLERGIRVL